MKDVYRAPVARPPGGPRASGARRGSAGGRLRALGKASRAVARGLLAAALPTVASAASAAQTLLAVELRAGAAYSTPFARGTTLVPAELEAVARDLEAGPRIGPVAELALAGGWGGPLVLEFRSGASIAGVAGKGGGFSWKAGRVTGLHVLAGARLPLSRPPGLDLRAGAGKMFYLSDGVHLLEGRERTGVLLSAGLGYRLPGPFPWTGLAEVQRHAFGPVPLAEAGGKSGAVTRIVAQVAVAVRGRS